MASFHFQVNQDRVPHKFAQRTVSLASGITQADIGKAVAVDTSAANTYKLAGDGETIVGRLEVVETDAKGNSAGIGTITHSFIEELPIKSGETVVVGDTVVGAGAGEVKALQGGDPLASAPNHSINYVTEVRTGFAVVVKI